MPQQHACGLGSFWPWHSRTQLFVQVVGGVAVTHSYYQHVLTTEGKTLEGEACQLLITKLQDDSLSMMPATQVYLGTELMQVLAGAC